MKTQLSFLNTKTNTVMCRTLTANCISYFSEALKHLSQHALVCFLNFLSVLFPSCLTCPCFSAQHHNSLLKYSLY